MADEFNYLAFFLDETVEILSDWERSCLLLEHGDQTEATESLYRGAHNLKSGSAAVGLTELSAFIHRAEDLLSAVLTGKTPHSPNLVRLLLDVHTLLTAWTAALRDDASYRVGEKMAAIDHELKELVGTGREHATAATAATPNAEPASEVAHDAPADPPAAQGAEAAAKHAKMVETVRVPAHKLDMLIQLVGELSTQQAIVWHGRQNDLLHSKKCDNAIHLIQKACKELQGVALSLRMQQLEPLFQRLERAARDLARKQDKKIEVICEGDHVELDKVVIERVTEALMHIIRNAVDHGIEGPEERALTGKDPVAILRLTGSQEPGGIMLKITEDGRGLNTERILKKAIEKGLARPDQSYSDAEIQRFIFLPGFSTAEKISDVSGRGVGMDVVKNAVQSIGGGISISSTPGHGSCFAVSLPTTLSIVDSLIIRVAGNNYAIPLQDVAEIIDLSGFKLDTAGNRGRMLSLRSAVVPVEALRDHLPPPADGPQTAQSTTEARIDSIEPALLVRSGTDTVAFRIDRVVGQQSVSIRPLPGGLDVLPGYTGASILGDGDPCIILNLPALVRRHCERLGSEGADHQRNAGAESATGAAAGAAGVAESGTPVAMLRHLVFRVENRLLATPLLTVREILSSSPSADVIGPTAQLRGRIDVRGKILPVIDLARSMKLRTAASNGPMIVVGTAAETVAVVVDQIEAVADLAVTETAGTYGVTKYRGDIITTIDLDRFSTDVTAGREAA